jgi:ABC-type cobalamin/Fe3+-siderophores transport system ATPase subunit
MTPLLRFESVSFAFGPKSILDSVSFYLEEGRCAALIGPNGVGKTTLLRLAAGLLECSSGQIVLADHPVSRLKRRERAQRIALVPQHVEVPFDFTVEQIVEQGRAPFLRLFGGPTPKDRLAIERAMHLAAVRPLAHRVFNELSGGERQRVKIALGLAQEPRLLLLDEPTQNLDIGRQVELLDLISSLRQEGITVLAAMHDLQLIPEAFSSVLLLSPEETLLQGSPQDILHPAILERVFNCPPQRHPVLVRQKATLKEKTV